VIELSEQQIMDQIADRLSDIYRDVPAETVSRLVHVHHSRYDGRPIRDFIPLFVERRARAELDKLEGVVSVS
jgi:hypothetical protein